MKRINKIHDLTGQKFGRLTVIELDNRPATKHTYWVCKCECGNITISRSDRLLSGTKKSCGCLKNEISAINVSKNHKHKQSRTRIYTIWQGLKRRCYNPANAGYARYGGRGIKVCDEWLTDFTPFYEWALANGYKDNLTIDRIDNNGDYSPDNCRWADIKTQCNNRSSNINITIGNATKTLTEWCEIFELDSKMIHARYKRNGFISIDDLFTV